MSHTFFDHNHNLQIHGDVNFFHSGGGSAEGDHNYLQVTQRVQATNVHSQIIKQGLKILCKHTAPSARYECDHAFTGPRCHPGTRVAVQDHIINWLDDENGPIAMWMNGPVGIGKSAIARTVADVAAVRMQLSSAFFFFRSDEARNSAKNLVATLAYEMTQQMPYTLEPVCAAITGNPLMFSSPLEHQFRTMLLQPLITPDALSLRVHRLIIIDGLDECMDTNAQRTIIRSFILGLLSSSNEIIPHRILIVSRPESHITSAFSAADISPHVKNLALESWNTEDDIGTFLRAKLDEIRQTHPLRHYLPDVWPDDHSFRLLRRRSIGSFAYASVVIRHLASHNDSPEHALDDLLSLQENQAVAAFADLDALYRHILLSLHPQMRFMLQKILCLYVYTCCAEINDLAEILSEDKFIVEIALIRTSSLIQIYDKHGQRIKFYHSSFQEFLLDKDRSGDLYIFRPNVARAVATALSCLWLQPKYHLYYAFSNMGSQIDDEFERWLDHRLDDMHAYVANVLVATKLPTTFCYDSPRSTDPEGEWPSWNVSDFCRFLQFTSRRCSGPKDLVYGPAFTVICDWMRSQFYRFFDGSPTVKAILDIIVEEATHSENWLYPFMDIFQDLTVQSEIPFYFLHRVFPEIHHLEIYSGILDRYQARMLRLDTKKSNKLLPYPWSQLYYHACNGVKLPEFSQRLEQILLEGMEGLGLVPDVYHYVRPRDCVFRYLYGPNCYLDGNYQLVTRDEYDLDRWPGRDQVSLADKVNQYICQTHREYDFPYMSPEVEALYRATSPAPFIFISRIDTLHEIWN